MCEIIDLATRLRRRDAAWADDVDDIVADSLDALREVVEWLAGAGSVDLRIAAEDLISSVAHLADDWTNAHSWITRGQGSETLPQ